ncbi:MAG: FmdB family zinc ribbon protein [Bacteroidota bacterium]
MPTYEYRCSNCGHELEEFQSMKDVPLITCPKCSHDSLFRVISLGGGMIFKGTGFYQTDYKKSNTSTAVTSTGKKSDTPKAESATTEKKSDSTASDSASKPSSGTKSES